MQQRLAGYLATLAADGYPVPAGAAELRSGQFHDVVLAGEVSYRFPRDEESRRALPGRMALLTALAASQLPAAIPVLLGAAESSRPLGSSYVVLTRLAGQPAAASMIDRPRATAALVVTAATVAFFMTSALVNSAGSAAQPAAQQGLRLHLSPRRWNAAAAV